MKWSNRTKRSFFLVIGIALCFVVLGTSVFAAALSDSQRDDYYAQYLQIAEEVNDLKLGCEVNVVPKDQIAENDWVTPEEFRTLAEDMAQTECNPHGPDDLGEVSPRSAMDVSETAKIKNDSASATIKISGTFATQLSEYRLRQLIEGVSSVSSAKSSGAGTWEPIGSEYLINDGGRTCTIYTSGKYTVGAVSVNTVASAEFYCSIEGKIS